MEYHEAAQIFPMMTPVELKEMADDIKAHGQEEAIVLLDGKILDGRNRWEACKIAGVKPWTIEATASQKKDPVAFVISKNLIRRQLTQLQRGIVAAKMRGIYDRQAKERQKGGQGGKLLVENVPQAKARDAAGKAVGVSGKVVDIATKVLKQGTPELIKAAETGTISANKAKEIASEPKKEQNNLLQETIEEKYKPKEKKKEVDYSHIRLDGQTFAEELKIIEDAIREIKSANVKIVKCKKEHGIGDKCQKMLDTSLAEITITINGGK